MTTEAQQLLDAAFAGKLDLDADASTINAADVSQNGSAANPEKVETPNAQTEQAHASTAAQEEEPVGAPVASKSGGYTIPYEKLTQARSERDTFKAENEQLKAQVAQLTASQSQNLANAQDQAQARADAGQAPTDADRNLAVAQAAAAQGVDMSLFGDFSEEAIAKGVAAMVEQRASALVDAKLSAALAPFQQRAAKSAAEAHSAAIYSAHKDADEIHESAEFKKWVGDQPSYARAAIERTLDGGETKDVIEVFSAFKAATGKSTPADTVAKALKDAQVQPPVSLSELPGTAGTSDAERVVALSGDPAKLLDFMSGLSPEKQNRLMNSVV